MKTTIYQELYSYMEICKLSTHCTQTVNVIPDLWPFLGITFKFKESTGDCMG